jgi:hypothetical protein
MLLLFFIHRLKPLAAPNNYALPGTTIRNLQRKGLMKKIAFAAITALFCSQGFALGVHSWKGTVHLVTFPLIEGSGIYSSVNMLMHADNTVTKAGAATNLSLIAVQAGLGAAILFGSDDLSPAIRTIHRIVGASIIASGLWISISGTLDNGVPSAARYGAYGHTALASVPLIMFSF